jgi:hypothetical protein
MTLVTAIRSHAPAALCLAAALLAAQAALAQTAATPVAVPVPVQPAPAATPPAAEPTAPAAGTVPAAPEKPADAPAGTASLDDKVQTLKGDVIKLNRDLLVLEEELLYPAGTQVAVFVSMDVGKLFSLESVQVRMGDKVLANYLYTAAEVAALHRGGVQRLFIGNLKTGKHELSAFFTGQGPHARDYKRATTLVIEKGTKYFELRSKESAGKLQPEFDVKVWQ